MCNVLCLTDMAQNKEENEWDQRQIWDHKPILYTYNGIHKYIQVSKLWFNNRLKLSDISNCILTACNSLPKGHFPSYVIPYQSSSLRWFTFISIYFQGRVKLQKCQFTIMLCCCIRPSIILNVVQTLNRLLLPCLPNYYQTTTLHPAAE